jgi:hypothetical protein
MSITGKPQQAADVGGQLATKMLEAGADTLVGERVV